MVSDLCVMEFDVVSFGPWLTQACAFNRLTVFLSIPISSFGTPFGRSHLSLLLDYLIV